MKKTVHYQKVSQGDLAITADKLVDFAKRDINELSSMGLTLDFLTRTEEQARILKSVIQHYEALGLRKGKTSHRNISLTAIKQRMEELKTQTMFAETIGQGEYAIVFNKPLSNKKPSYVLQTALSMLNVLTSSEEDLTIYGVTPEVIADFAAQIEDLNAKIVAQEISRDSFGEFKDEREAEKAKLAKSLRFIAAVGQTYWRRKNSTKYREYAVLRTSNSTSSATEGEPTQTATTQEGQSFQLVS